MSIDRIDLRVLNGDFPSAHGARSEPVEGQHHVGLGVAAALARTAVMVALASLAILVLLPAALAAQSASAF